MDDATPSVTPLSQIELDKLTDLLIEKFKTVFDPEIPVDIYELGLIYKVDVSDTKDVAIDMTLTAPGCPVAWYQGQRLSLLPQHLEVAARNRIGVSRLEALNPHLLQHPEAVDFLR